MNSKVIKQLFSILIFLGLISILVYNIFLIFQAIIMPNKTPNILGIKTYVIISGSMEPELNIGDMVIVKEISDYELNVGDIISYRNGQSVITHRIEKIHYNNGQISYITKGDANNVEDSTIITNDDIEGKVINKLSGIGNIILFLQSKYSIILITVIFFLYFMSRKKKKEVIKNDAEDRKCNS